MPDINSRIRAIFDRTRTESEDAEAGAVAHEAIPALPLLDEGRFQIGGERGRGGIGVVFEATDRLIGRHVALKQPHAREDGAQLARFIREALITARLQHPAIVPVYDIGLRATGAPWYSMRLVPGATLRDAIAAAPGLDERLALLPHVQAVADALAYAHENEVVHRDLKPANVLVGSFGETVVIDWGLAKDRGEGEFGAVGSPLTGNDRGEPLTQSGTVMGTPGYMPPEQAAGEDVDERADVFAIGAILYHLLTGKAPYGPGDPTAVLAGPPVPVPVREPGAPRDLVAIVTKAMAPRPADRYASAHGIALDLKRFATGQLVGARHYGWWALIRHWLRRHRAAALASLAIAAALVTGGVSVVRERNRTAAENNRLRLVQAQTSVERDPTAAAAWLKEQRPEPGAMGRAVDVAARAEAAGVARHVLTLPGDAPVKVCLSESGGLAGVLGRQGAIWVYDLQGPRPSRRHLGELAAPPGGCVFLDGGRRLAAAPASGPLQLWDLARAQAITVAVPGELGRLQGLADGRLLVSNTSGRMTLVGNDGVARPLFSLPAGTRDLALVGGRVLYAIATDGGLWRVPLDGGPPARVELDRAVIAVDAFRDGLRLALGTEGEVGVHDIATGRTTWRRILDAAPGQDYLIVRAATGGPLYVSAAAGNIGQWELESDSLVPLGGAAYGRTLEVTADQGRAMWADEGGTIHVADLAARTEHTLIGDRAGTMHVSEAAARTGGMRLGDHTTIRALTMTGDGRWLAATHGVALRLYALPPARARRLELRGRALIRTLPGRAQLVALLHDDSLVAMDVYTGARGPVIALGERVLRMAGSFTDSHAAVVTVSGRVVLADAITGVHRQLDGGRGPWIGLEFAPRELLALNDKGELHAWDLASGAHRLVAADPSDSLSGGLSVSLDGSRVMIGSERRATLVDVSSGRTWRLDYAGGSYMRDAFSRDGSKILISVEDGRMFLWETQGTQLRQRTITQLTGAAADILFLPGEGSVLIAEEGGGLEEIDLQTGARREIGRHPAHVNSATVSPSGRWLATVDVSGEVRLWEPRTGALTVIPGRCKSAFLRPPISEDRIAVAGAGGCAEVHSVDLGRLVPTSPPALAAWLEGITTARIDAADEPVSP
jgi:hypothetical protein